MKTKIWIFIVLIVLLITSIIIVVTKNSNPSNINETDLITTKAILDDLYKSLDSPPSSYDCIDDLSTGSIDEHFSRWETDKLIVYYYPRMVDDARVELDQIVCQYNKSTGKLFKQIVQWRDDLPKKLPPNLISKEQAESIVEGNVHFSFLYFISLESIVFPIKPTPKNPCWVVYSTDESNNPIVTIIDATTGEKLGYGLPPPAPYTAFSLAGPSTQLPCGGTAYSFYAENARDWFNSMEYNTENALLPDEAKIRDHIRSYETAVFYEFAHGDYEKFVGGCVGNTPESTTSSEIYTWILNYTKMPFTFLGSCDGMCSTGAGTLSYEFRKGSTKGTATVGYCHLAEDFCWDCWINSFHWQNALFNYTNHSYTVKAAFDQANADYSSGCGNQSHNCTRFAGDETLKIAYPKVARVPQFYVRDSSEKNLARFANTGDILLKGKCFSGGTCSTPGDEDSFIISNFTDEAVAYINSTGDLCLEKGDCSDQTANCNPTRDAFIIRNASNTNVSYIDFDGDLCLIGELFEDSIV